MAVCTALQRGLQLLIRQNWPSGILLSRSLCIDELSRVCTVVIGVVLVRNFIHRKSGLLGLGLGLEAKFSGLGLGLETSGLGLDLVFLALALVSFKAKAKVKVTNILPNTVYHGIITLTVHWYTSVIGTAIAP